MANLMLSSIMSAKLDESATLKEMQFSLKKDAVFIHSLKHELNTFTSDATDCLVRDLKSLSITFCFLFFLPSIFLSRALFSRLFSVHL